jgi:hypothetical protein
MTLAPMVEGTASIRSPAKPFLESFQRRVAAGLLTGRPHPRSNYVVTQVEPNSLHIRAADWWTAINVGLNELDIQVAAPNVVHYCVRYWRWAGYALGLGCVLGGIGLIFLLFTDVRSYIAQNSAHRFPGLSIDQNLGLAWGMVLFWGFVWPWLLIALRRGPLRRLVERLIGESDAASGVAAPV